MARVACQNARNHWTLAVSGRKHTGGLFLFAFHQRQSKPELRRAHERTCDAKYFEQYAYAWRLCSLLTRRVQALTPV
jgi:hypothetical protein